MGATVARKIAFQILLRVEKTSAYAGDLLHARLTPETKPEDAALATELTLGVLRWQRLLDFQLAPRLAKPAMSGRPLETLDREVLVALRLGLYQLRCLDRVPPHAAVNESVALVREARKRSAAGLVNAVLRNSVATARQAVERLVPPDTAPAERLGILHSHPTWMIERWLARFGEKRTIALLEANNRPAELACIMSHPRRGEELADQLRKSGTEIGPGRWLREARIVSSANPAVQRVFRRGKLMFMDEASQMVARLLDVARATYVLDLCAAPGGKTALLARAARPGAILIAGDLHPSRLRAMRERLGPPELAHIRYVALNATRPLPFAVPFERILADAPCSGTGTLRRNPEIRWRLAPDDLGDLHGRQVKLLSQALAALAPGGRLVYSTCSLEPEENEDVVHEALRDRRELRIISGAGTLAPHLSDPDSVAALFDAEGFFRTFPPEHQTDGFFAAVLERPVASAD